MNRPAENPDRLVLLARTHVAGERGATGAQLRDALKSLQPTAAHADLDATRDRHVAELCRDGLLEPDGRRTVCSPRGRERLSDALGLRGESRPTWTALRDGLLLAHALELPVPDEGQLRRFRSASGVRAAVLARERSLGLLPYPTAKEVIDAAGWTALAELLGEELSDWRRHALGSGAIVSCVLGHRLGLRRALTASKLLALLAATAVGARSDDVRALRAAVLARWRAHAHTAPREELDGVASFVRAVHEAARVCAVGHFGPGLVFVADLFDAFASRHPGTVTDLQDFKTRVLHAARAGQLSLVRADLVEAMDADTVRRSEIRDLHATFHFVRV